jgi:Zn-dependent alcohol dehydrogenase
MRAALLEGPGKPFTLIDDLEVDDPRQGEVRVRVTHCGVCHSDLSIADGAFPAPLPIVLGHEAAGVVEDLGPGVTGLSRGDRVVLTPAPPCGTCYGCVRGEPGVCVNLQGLMTSALPDGRTGLSRRGEKVFRGVNLGAFSERVILPATGAVKVADDVPTEVVCVIGCAVQTGVGAVFNTARVSAGATVLVMGLGGIGLSVVQGARIAGAARILASDPLASRRAAATQFGATDVFDPTQQDVPQAARDCTGGIGVDYAFETAGRAALVQTGLAALRNGGTVVCVGAPPIAESIQIPLAAAFVISEKKVVGCTLGSSNSLREIPRLVALWQAGRLDLEAMITRRRPLAEIDQAFEDLRQGRGIRTVLSV